MQPRLCRLVVEETTDVKISDTKYCACECMADNESDDEDMRMMRMVTIIIIIRTIKFVSHSCKMLTRTRYL